MSKQKTKAGASPAPIVFEPKPLDADAYYIRNLTANEMRHLRLAWSEMNKTLPKPVTLLVVPEAAEIDRVPSSLLKEWRDKINAILKERGEWL